VGYWKTANLRKDPFWVLKNICDSPSDCERDCVANGIHFKTGHFGGDPTETLPGGTVHTAWRFILPHVDGARGFRDFLLAFVPEGTPMPSREVLKAYEEVYMDGYFFIISFAPTRGMSGSADVARG